MSKRRNGLSRMLSRAQIREDAAQRELAARVRASETHRQQQIEAEDDYRICVRRGSEVEAKPTRKSRKRQEDDE